MLDVQDPQLADRPGDTGAVRGPDDVFQWDGVQRWNPAWNRDHDLRSAIRDSVVWYYQELARRIGAERMSAYLAHFDYGNQDISGGLTTFWVGSTLTISADEQVVFLRKLVTSALPVSAHSRAAVCDILINPDWTDGTLRGKTGSYFSGTAPGSGAADDLGWYVGWLERSGQTCIFAANISGAGACGPRAREICQAVLREQVRSKR